MSYDKPLPIPDDDSRPYFEALRNRRLAIQQCKDCGTYRFPPRNVCPSCLSMESEWTELTGHGQVYTFTIAHHAVTPAFSDSLLFVVAVIELEEGVRMVSNVVGCEPQDVRIGMPVSVVYDDATEQITLPKFRPTG